MKNKLLKTIIIGTSSVSIGAGIGISIPSLINQTHKTSTNTTSNNMFKQKFDGDVHVEMQDKDGNIWLGNYDGLYKSTDRDTFNKLNSYTEIANAIFQDSLGNIWVSGQYGLYKSTNDGATFKKMLSTGVGMTMLYEDKDGNIWAGGSGLYKSSDGTNFVKISTVPDSGVATINQGQYGSIWVGTGGGLYQSTGGDTFKKIIIPDGISSSMILQFLIAKDGNIWVGTGGGLYKSTNGGGTFFLINHFGDHMIFGLYQSSKNIIYVYANTMWVEASTDGIKFEQILTFATNTGFTVIYEDKDGNIWLGSYEGLYKSNDGKQFFSVNGGSVGTTIFQDSSGNIWVGIDDGLWKKIPEVIFTPESAHKTIKEEGRTIYISDKSIKLNIPPADQIIIDEKIISNTKEITQYIFDSTKSPHTIIVSISGQDYTILVYIVESSVIENGLNYSYYNPTTDELSIYMNQTIVEGIKLTYEGRPQGVDFLSFVEASNKWNDFKSNEGLKNNLVNNLGMDWEMGFDLISSIDSQLTQSTGFISKDYTTAFINKINAMNPTDGISLKIEVDIDNGPAINNLGSPEINTDDMTTKYWDDILFNQIYKNGGS